MVRTDPGSDGDDTDTDRLAQTAEQSRSGWTQAVADMEAMAADRAATGYETLTVAAGDTAPKAPDTGDSEEWGLTYVVPSNVADEFTALHARADFEETGVYQADDGPNRFVVTECLDHDARIALFVAGTFRLRFATPLVETALDRGKMLTHVKKLDGTPLGSIEHDDPEAFFPEPETVYAHGR